MPRPPVGDANKVITADQDPIAILKTRLARGEITVEEYQRLFDVLSR